MTPDSSKRWPNSWLPKTAALPSAVAKALRGLVRLVAIGHRTLRAGNAPRLHAPAVFQSRPPNMLVRMYAGSSRGHARCSRPAAVLAEGEGLEPKWLRDLRGGISAYSPQQARGCARIFDAAHMLIRLRFSRCQEVVAVDSRERHLHARHEAHRQRQWSPTINGASTASHHLRSVRGESEPEPKEH